LNVGGKPTLEFIRIAKNFADSSGAGFYDLGGTRLLKNCMLQSNISKKGCGAGYYYQNGNLEIDASVFEGNILQDTMPANGGAAIYTINSTVNMVNCVFAANNSQSKSGAVYNKKGTCKIINTTFAGNTSRINARCLSNDSATTSIVNSILWNEGGDQELTGDSLNVTYSCIRGGYSGTGNISNDPLFTGDITRPAGTDGKYGTFDDGLMVKLPSKCIGTGTNTGYPEVDFLGYKRYGPTSDIGAYAYQQNNNELIGIISPDGKFVPTPTFPVVTDLTEERNVISCLVAGYGRVIQIELPKNEYTDKKNQISVEVSGTDAGGTIIGTPQIINFYRVGSSQFFRSYYNEKTRLGKIIVFTDDVEMQGEFTYAHVIMGAAGGKVRISVARKQFK